MIIPKIKRRRGNDLFSGLDGSERTFKDGGNVK